MKSNFMTDRNHLLLYLREHDEAANRWKPLPSLESNDMHASNMKKCEVKNMTSRLCCFLFWDLVVFSHCVARIPKSTRSGFCAQIHVAH